MTALQLTLWDGSYQSGNQTITAPKRILFCLQCEDFTSNNRMCNQGYSTTSKNKSCSKGTPKKMRQPQ